MKYAILLFSLFLFPFSNLKSQTIITGVVTDSLNTPIPFASVFLSKTTIGILTDSKGAYSLTITQNGVYEMITSYIGYKTFSQFINAEGKNQKINIKLSVNLVLLKEVTVKSKDKNRLANYTQFIKLFLGETFNSQYCKILNPEDLHLYWDEQDKVLSGFSLRPLQIENRALGYIINYDLTDFNFNPETGFLRFKGNLYFNLISGSPRENKRWERNRLSAFYGSRMDLFRAIFSDSLYTKDFKIFECKTDSLTSEIIINKPILVKDLSLSKNSNFMALFYTKPVLISYTDNHSELATGITGFQPQNAISTIQFTDFINVYQNGYYDSPYAITWGGQMADERIADMLPYDFLPYAKEKVDSDYGEVISPIEKYLISQQNNNSRDQVFVHTDRNLYAPGDTIRFQAYIRDRFTNVLESKSVSLYAILFNDKQIVIDSSRFKIYNSLSSGWIAIPSKTETGKFHFVAFTGMMQNYDPMDAFQLDLYVRTKDYNNEKVEVEFDKENYQPGDTVEAILKIIDVKGEPVSQRKFQTSLAIDKYNIESSEKSTNRKGESVIRFILPDTLSYQPRFQVITKKNINELSVVKDFKIPFVDQYFELRFLPEGGTLVAGIPQRIGFNATDFKGEPVFIEGLLKNSSGTTLDTIKSGTYGPGIFSCTPQPGMFVELLNRSEKEKNWPLPEPVNTGLSLCVKRVDDKSFAVEIQSTGYNGEMIKVSGVLNAASFLSEDLKMDKKQRIVVNTDLLQSGISQITLFNKDLNPLAERLFYVNADKHLQYKINTGKDIYTPGQETELTVSVTDGQGNPVEGIFSISVADSLSGYDAEIFTPGIEYTFNYHPDLHGNLPPKVLVKGLENISNDERDILLMVYGWSKYNWDFNQKAKAETELVNYDFLNMKIMYALKSHRAGRHLDLISLEGPSIMHLLTNKEGKISLPLDSLPEITRSVTMMPDTKNNKIVMGAMLSIPTNEQYFKSRKLFTSLPDIPLETYNVTSANYNFSLGDSVIEIPEVTIKGSPENKKIYHDKYEEMYNYGEVKSLDYELLWTSFSVTDAVYRLIIPFALTDNYIILRPPRSFFGGSVPALIVLDGVPLYYQGWNRVRSLPASELTSLTILMGKQGYARYGEAAQGGVIFVNTRSDDPNLMKLHTKWILQNKKDNMLLPIIIYRADKEFYKPTKFDIDNDPVIQRRSTIFWEPEVYFDGKEPVKISYNNLKHKGPVIITINGASVNNLVGTGRAGYRVY